MKTIILFITEGFRIRNLLYSNVLPLLKQQARVVIVVPPDDVEKIRAAFGEGDAVVVEGRPESPMRFESKLSFVRRFLLSNPARNKTVSVFSTIMKKQQPFHYWLVRNVNPWLGRSVTVRRLWLKLEAKINRGAEYAGLFAKYSPSLVVTTDYGSQTQEVRILRYAKARGIRTASVVYSWDNFSSKGVMAAIADRLLVWSEIMRREAQEFHDIDPATVDVCGAAQFDVYGTPSSLASREDFCRQVGLDPARPFITQGTITPRFFPTNIEIAEILIAGIQSGRLPSSLQLLIRLHPQVVNKGVAADSIEPYRELERKYPFVKVDVPQTVNWGSMVSPAREDGQRLAEILRHTAVIIHPGSTLAVDAAAMDCPVIGLGFDGHEPKDYEESVRRWWDFTYMQPVVRSGGQPIAHDKDELYALVQRYLQDRSADREGRRLICDQVCYRVDGRSAERVASALLKSIG
ncbi:MAG: hypothetical protein NDI75_13905 [Candidatus Didemnitutus sp.]|nr:hypothetical protein [Candidatus Didemnitutus sp.]